MTRWLLMGWALAVLACTPASDGRGEDAGPDPDVSLPDGGMDIPDADPGRPDAGPPLSPEQIAVAAALFASCVPDDGAARFAYSAIYDRRRTDTWPGDLGAGIGCLAGRDDGCDGVSACMGVRVDLTGPCAEECVGDVFVACDDALRFEFDCGVLGLQCSVDDGPCLPADAAAPPACAVPDFDQLCVGGVPATCEGGEARPGVPCAPYGLVCAEIDGDSATCQGTAGACNAESWGPNRFHFADGRSCIDQDTLEVCIGDGLHHLDCATLGEGYRCFAPDGEPAYCGLSDACNPAAGPDARCDGGALELCVAGRLEQVDCAAVGLGPCQGQGRGSVCARP